VYTCIPPFMGRFRLIGGSRRLVLMVEDLDGEGRGLARIALMLVGANGRLGGLWGFIWYRWRN
jgi:hypothetical protein